MIQVGVFEVEQTRGVVYEVSVKREGASWTGAFRVCIAGTRERANERADEVCAWLSRDLGLIAYRVNMDCRLKV